MNKKIKQNEGDSVLSETEIATSDSALTYEKPVLICYGDVRDITLGPSIGIGESGISPPFAALSL